jgi:putative cell wall-binding protein
VVGVASGTSWADTVTGASAMALLGGPLLLTEPEQLSGSTSTSIDGMRSSLTSAIVVGGERAVTPGVFGSLRSLGF